MLLGKAVKVVWAVSTSDLNTKRWGFNPTLLLLSFYSLVYGW